MYFAFQAKNTNTKGKMRQAAKERLPSLTRLSSLTGIISPAMIKARDWIRMEKVSHYIFDSKLNSPILLVIQKPPRHFTGRLLSLQISYMSQQTLYNQ